MGNTKHSRLLFPLTSWYFARSISPITPGLIHLVPRDKAPHLFEVAICNRLLFLDASTRLMPRAPYRSCAPFVTEKLPVRKTYPPDGYYKRSKCWPLWECFLFLSWFFIISSYISWANSRGFSICGNTFTRHKNSVDSYIYITCIFPVFSYLLIVWVWFYKYRCSFERF